MDLIIVIVLALTVLSAMDTRMWPRPKGQIKRQWLRRLARQRGGGRQKKNAQ